MNLITTLLAKSSTAATIEFLVFMVVAAIIAFFAAYFYYRSVYTKKISVLEAEKEGLERKAAGLQAANDELNKKIEELEKDK